MMHVDEACSQITIELGKIEPASRTGQTVSSNASFSGWAATFDLTLYDVSTRAFEVNVSWVKGILFSPMIQSQRIPRDAVNAVRN